MTRVEDGFTEEAQPQQSAILFTVPCDGSPAAADAASVPPGPVSRPSFSPKRFASPKELLMAEYLKPEETAAAAAQIAAQIPPRRHCSHQRVAVGQLPKPLPEKENPAALFENGWLRKGGGAFIVAPSGVGKSVLTLQAAFCWALGREFMGITPVRPLDIVIIQAEDDRDEIAFFRDCIRRGLVNEFGFTEEELDVALGTHDPSTARVHMYKVVAKVGETFVQEVGAYLDDYPSTDLIMVNPFQSYFGADCSKNVDISQFLRVWLDKEIKDPADEGKDRAAVMFVHHTNKPPSSNDDREGWGVDQFAAYIGSGGAEMVNWARAILSLMPTKLEGVFRLCAGKRGQRLKWIDVSTGKRTRCKIIKHAEGEDVYWRPCDDVDAIDLEATKNTKGVRGAVGGNGGGGVPPVPELKLDNALAVSLVDAHPDLSANQYVAKIQDAIAPKTCGDNTARRLLARCVRDGQLSCEDVNRCKRYALTEKGKELVGELNF